MGAALGLYELEVYGLHGAISLRNGVFNIRWFSAAQLPPKTLDKAIASRNRAYPSDEIPWHEEHIPVDQKLQADIFADFARAIRTGSTPFVPPAESVLVTEMLERCRRAAGRVLYSRR